MSFICGSNSVGRVTAFQAVGRGFESRLPLKKMSWEMMKELSVACSAPEVHPCLPDWQAPAVKNSVSWSSLCGTKLENCCS